MLTIEGLVERILELAVDSLEGEVLSWAVGEAMGYEMYEDTIFNRQCYKSSDGVYGYWHPHDDAKQALEVWQALIALDDGYTFEMDSEGAGVYHSGYDELLVAGGTAHTAICRAYLKERLRGMTHVRREG